MKDGVKIKTTKSFNGAKAVAEAEQAEVFCNGEKVYSAINTVSPVTPPAPPSTSSAPSSPSDEQKQAPVSPVSDEKFGEQKTETAAESPKAYRIKALMNVRKAPSLNAERIAAIEAGKIVNVYDIKDDWMKVKWGNWGEGIAYILYKNGEFAEPAKG